MAGVPAGMESDVSDSDDCDIVYNLESSSPRTGSTKPLRKYEIVNVQESNEGFFAGRPDNATVLETNGHKQSPINTQPGRNKLGNNSIKHLGNHKQRRRQCIDHVSAQPLDDLRFAVMQGSLETTKSIIEGGIWVDTVLKAGWTALMYACSCGHHEIVEYLLMKKADPNYHRDMFTPLMASCASSKDEGGLLKCVCYLLEHGASVNVQERHHTTPLMFAAREGHLEIVKKLLQHEVELDKLDNRGRTALTWAASNGHGQTVSILLNAGADPCKVTLTGQSPTDLAYEQGHKEVAKILEKAIVQKGVAGDTVEQVDLKMSSPLSSNVILEIDQNVQGTLNSIPQTKYYVRHGEMEIFLTGLGLSELISTFDLHHISFCDLLVMTEEDMEKIGIDKFGVRKKILEATKMVHKKEWENSSLPNLKEYQYISCPDAVAVMANIAKHLRFVESTVIYIRHQIQAYPRILEFGQDSSNVHDLLDETEEGLKNVRLLYDELRFLKMYLDKLQDNVQYIPADLIVQTVPSISTQWKGIKVVLGIAVVAFTVGGLLWKKPESFTSFLSIIPFRTG